MIYPEIEVLVESLISLGKHVYLCTNGILLAKKIHSLCPGSRLLINVHLDGMEATHDRLAERPGVFEEAIHGIVAAKSAGLTVCTNTTVYRDTDMHEIAVLFDYLRELDVDGFMISPAFSYAAVQQLRCQRPGRYFHDAGRGPRQVSRGAGVAGAVPADGFADLHGISPR